MSLSSFYQKYPYPSYMPISSSDAHIIYITELNDLELAFGIPFLKFLHSNKKVFLEVCM
jgi:hypothetical protein